MAKITFLAYDHCLFSGIAGMIDAFSICNAWIQYYASQNETNKKGKVPPPDAPPLFETEIVSHHGKEIVTNGGLRVHVDRAMEDVDHTDLILLSPYLIGSRPSPEFNTDLPDILDWIKGHYASNTRIGAGCTAVFILAMTGLLDGKMATTNWQFVRRFKHMFPKVHLKPERVFTVDQGLICTGAVTAQYNMVLYIIEAFASKSLSRKCAKAFLVDPGRESQAPYMITNFWKNHGDREITKAQHWMEEHYTESISIDDVADYSGLSPRHFKRRFKKATDETPLAYLQQIRLEAAKKRLETTQDNIDEITRNVGYEDSSTFRRLFKKYTSLSPREYRDRFSICRPNA